MASTDAAGRNSEAYELLLGVLGTEKALSSDDVYYLGNRLRSALNTNSAFKSIQKAEEKRVLEELGKNAVSVGLSISPVGTFKDIAELIYGKDVITQAELSTWDKLLNVIGLDAVKAMKKVTQIAQVAMIIDVAKIADVKVLNSMADTVKLAKMKATGLISKTKMTSNLAKGMGDDLVDIVEEGVSRSKVKMNIQLFAEGGSKSLDEVTIINKRYAGKTFKLTDDLAIKYPDGVKFTNEGFPDFSPYSSKTITVKGLQGDTYYDFIKANQAAGYKITPKGFTWHHVEDGTTMMLVPTDLHGAVRHTGGASLIRNGIRP